MKLRVTHWSPEEPQRGRDAVLCFDHIKARKAIGETVVVGNNVNSVQCYDCRWPKSYLDPYLASLEHRHMVKVAQDVGLGSECGSVTYNVPRETLDQIDELLRLNPVTDHGYYPS